MRGEEEVMVVVVVVTVEGAEEEEEVVETVIHQTGIQIPMQKNSVKFSWEGFPQTPLKTRLKITLENMEK